MNLQPCPSCGRHVHADDARCPFCDNPARPSRGRRALHMIGGALTTVVLAACYGTGTWDDEETDLDGDGFPVAFDCDDNDAEINPDAVEICDDSVDNDCDEQVDAADSDCVDTDDTDDTDA